MAVQLAKWKGARVIGLASGRNHAFLRELGVDECIDYTTTRFEYTVRDADAVLEMFGGDTVERSLAVLRKGGVFVSVKRTPPPELAAEHGVRTAYVLCKANSRQLHELAAAVCAGHLKPHVSAVLPLAEARQALELSETRHTRGKLVLKVRA